MKINDIERFSSYLDYRTNLIFLIGNETGLRISDIINLKRADIKRTLKIKEKKTGKKFKHKFSNELYYLIINYMKYNEFNEYLFGTNSKEHHITRQAVWKAFKKAAKEAGEQSNIGTHSMRKNKAWKVFTETNSIKEARKALNHDNSNCIIYYIWSDEIEN